jgi:hypothetical protein
MKAAPADIGQRQPRRARRCRRTEARNIYTTLILGDRRRLTRTPAVAACPQPGDDRDPLCETGGDEYRFMGTPHGCDRSTICPSGGQVKWPDWPAVRPGGIESSVIASRSYRPGGLPAEIFPHELEGFGGYLSLMLMAGSRTPQAALRRGRESGEPPMSLSRELRRCRGPFGVRAEAGIGSIGVVPRADLSAANSADGRPSMPHRPGHGPHEADRGPSEPLSPDAWGCIALVRCPAVAASGFSREDWRSGFADSDPESLGGSPQVACGARPQYNPGTSDQEARR